MITGAAYVVGSEAVTRFEEDGDYDQLLFCLGTSYPVIADSVVSRVIIYRNLPH